MLFNEAMAGAGIIVHLIDLLESINALDRLGIKRAQTFKRMQHDAFQQGAEGDFMVLGHSLEHFQHSSF